MAELFLGPDDQPCGPRAEFVFRLEHLYHEHSILQMLDNEGNLLELFASPDGATWTMLITKPGLPTCTKSDGDHLSLNLQSLGENP